MKKRNKLILIAIIGFVGIALFTGCNKGLFNHSPEKKAQWIIEEITDELNLSELQVEKLESVKDYALNLRKEMKPKHESTHRKFISLLSQPTLDQEKLTSIINEKTALVNEKAPEIITLLAGFYDELNSEQQTLLQEALEKKMSRHHKHH